MYGVNRDRLEIGESKCAAAGAFQHLTIIGAYIQIILLYLVIFAQDYGSPQIVLLLNVCIQFDAMPVNLHFGIYAHPPRLSILVYFIVIAWQSLLVFYAVASCSLCGEPCENIRIYESSAEMRQS